MILLRREYSESKIFSFSLAIQPKDKITIWLSYSQGVVKPETEKDTYVAWYSINLLSNKNLNMPNILVPSPPPKVISSGPSPLASPNINGRSLPNDPDELQLDLRTKEPSRQMSEESSETARDEGDGERSFMCQGETFTIETFNYPEEIYGYLNIVLKVFDTSVDQVVNYIPINNMCRLLESLFEAKDKHLQLLRMFCSEEKMLNKLISHIGTTSVCNLFRNAVLGCKDEVNSELKSQGDSIASYRLYIYHRLIEILFSTQDLFEVESISHILKQLLTDRSKLLESGYLIRKTVLSDVFFNRLISHLCVKVDLYNKRVVQPVGSYLDWFMRQSSTVLSMSLE
jgi:hypothetical protein